MAAPHHPSQPVSIIEIWHAKLVVLYDYYCTIRSKTRFFFARLFLFFFVLNICCYWLAMVTAFPRYIFGSSFIHYFKISFPVGLLGALFDSLSFFITLWLVRKAIVASTKLKFVADLSIDFVIAVIATWWVLCVFAFSGWLINIVEGSVYTKDASGRYVQIRIAELDGHMTSDEIRDLHFQQRINIYTQRLLDAVQRPFDNIRNIYFGIAMGISAMTPTCVHISMFLQAFVLSYRKIRPQPAHRRSPLQPFGRAGE